MGRGGLGLGLGLGGLDYNNGSCSCVFKSKLIFYVHRKEHFVGFQMTPCHKPNSATKFYFGHLFNILCWVFSNTFLILLFYSL